MGTPLQVFLIEDSIAICETLIQSIESKETVKVVGVADNAKDALRALKQIPVDVVIVDLRLRDSSGFEVLETLQAIPSLSHITRIVLTNYAAAIYRERCKQLGAHYFFDKSLEFDQVIGMLHKLVQPANPA